MAAGHSRAALDALSGEFSRIDEVDAVGTFDGTHIEADAGFLGFVVGFCGDAAGLRLALDAGIEDVGAFAVGVGGASREAGADVEFCLVPEVFDFDVHDKIEQDALVGAACEFVDIFLIGLTVEFGVAECGESADGFSGIFGIGGAFAHGERACSAREVDGGFDAFDVAGPETGSLRAAVGFGNAVATVDDGLFGAFVSHIVAAVSVAEAVCADILFFFRGFEKVVGSEVFGLEAEVDELLRGALFVGFVPGFWRHFVEWRAGWRETLAAFNGSFRIAVVAVVVACGKRECGHGGAEGERDEFFC